MATKKVKPRTLGSPGFAVVNAKGKPVVESTSVDRESAEMCLTDDRVKKGYKVRRVRVMLERQGRSWG